jgi:hypothetical protein
VIPETSALSDLIGTLYDTALERALWPDVLEKLAEFVGGSAASIYCKNSSTGAVYHQFGVEPHYQQLYFSKYVRLDPTTAAHCLTGIGQLVSTVDFIPYCEFVETPFYREWGRPQGLADFLTTPLDKSADSVALFGVFRNEQHGLVDEAMRRRAALVVPHIRRAAVIGNVLMASIWVQNFSNRDPLYADETQRLLQTRPIPDRNNRPSTTSRKFLSLKA